MLLIEINDEFNLNFIESKTNYKFDSNKFSESKSIITILDGFGKYNEEFLIKLFENISLDTNIIGGRSRSS